MIERVYRSAAGAVSIQEVLVATDDDRIVDVVESFGGRALMTSDTCRSGTDRVAEVAELLNLADRDIVINIQGDQPLVRSECFDQVVRPLLDDTDLGMSTLAIRIRDDREYKSSKDCKVAMDRQGYALYFSRAPIPFARDEGDPAASYKHLGIYAYRRGFLDIFRNLPTGTLERIEKLEQLRALEYGYRIKVVLTDHDSPEVDLPEDIPRIEALLADARD